MNIDLHCHSTVSDGKLAPEAVVQRAHANGVTVLSLTDHDETGGAAAAAAEAATLGLTFIPGVEVSVTWANQTVHIVGLRVDPDHPTLVEGLRATRGGRGVRAREMGEKLAAAGVPDAYEGALRYVGNPALISRTHFARHLVASGICPDIPSVFDRYLSPGKPGYVDTRWATLADAVGWIRAAGGQAVIAHPGRYAYSPNAFHALFETFLDLGGVGIEVVTGSHVPAQYAEYAEVARRYGFLASRGSDFHSPDESRVDLGALPSLPARVKPIWHDWF